MNPDISDDRIEDLAATAQEKAQYALRAGQSYAKENPLVLAAGALVFGIAIGALFGNREPKRKETGQAARELVDDIVSQFSHRLKDLKKQSCSSSSNILDQVQGAGKKLKWW